MKKKLIKDYRIFIQEFRSHQGPTLLKKRTEIRIVGANLAFMILTNIVAIEKDLVELGDPFAFRCVLNFGHIFEKHVHKIIKTK